MKEFEPLKKTPNPQPKSTLIVSRPPTTGQLRSKTTDELVRMLMSPDLARPMNAPLRQQIIKVLQEREGNAFVQRLLGTKSK
jgi:hypothetical protein